MFRLLGFQKAGMGSIIFLVLISAGLVLGQQIGGPYTPDANTMLLMHFDGDYSNVSPNSADGITHGAAFNFYFLPHQMGLSHLNQCLRIDNDSQSDSAYVYVPDTSSLDLIHNWTIEGWINIFTFGTGSSDWRWVPRLVIKTGDANFWQPNYFVEMWGSTRFFSCGYHTASQDQWPQANSAANVMEVGQWYHMAFVRDTSSHLLLTIIHKFNSATQQIELASFTAADYLSFGAIDPTPIVTNQALHIGYAGGGGDSYLDGFVDEIRVSNVVRDFPVPPVIANVTVMTNQTTSVPQYEIGADVLTLFPGTTLQRAELFYSLDAGTNWTTVTMTTVMGDSMVGVIPQQPLGTIIFYYLEAEDNSGRIFQYPRQAGFQSADYYSFGIYSANTQTLDMTFEEGSGMPVDYSQYANPVSAYGTPSHSPNAAAGNYALYLEGDSSALELDTPFLAASEFLVDFWFRPDDVMRTAAKNYCRFLNRPRDASSWSNNNYQLRVNPGGLLYAGTDGAFNITLDDTLRDRWYHVQLEVRNAPPGDTVLHYAVLRMEDAAGTVRQQKYVGFDADVVQGFAPLRIGKAAGTDVGGYPPFFKGYYDNIMIYNYAAGQLPLQNITSIDGKEVNLAFNYELSQNYPNPFNPSTDIRFSIAQTGKVTINVFDILGRKVKTLANAYMTFGNHVVQWDGTDDYGYPVASGVYVYRLETKNFTKSMKMILMK